MLAGKSQADMTYVEIRTHTVDKSQRGSRSKEKLVERNSFHRVGLDMLYGGETSGSRNDAYCVSNQLLG